MKLLRVKRHEAAHAVAGYIMGFEPLKIYFKNGDGKTEIDNAPILNSSGNQKINYIKRMLIVILAGSTNDFLKYNYDSWSNSIDSDFLIQYQADILIFCVINLSVWNSFLEKLKKKILFLVKTNRFRKR